MAQDTGCLYSTIKNSSGVRMTFGFLPPHGRTLNSLEEYTVYGHVVEAVSRGTQTQARRNQKALEAALNAGAIKIISTPSQIFYDANVGVAAPRQLQVANGVISSVVPCWENTI